MAFILKSAAFSMMFIMLYGCGGSSSSDFEIYGTWQYQTDIGQGYTVIQEGSATDYSYTELYECYTVQSSTISHITENLMTVVTQYGNIFNYQWSISGDKLTVGSDALDGNSESISSSINIDALMPCSDLSKNDIGTINISITFQNLPETIQVNNELNTDQLSDYYLGINFDIDNNEEEIGDLQLSIDHLNFNQDPPTTLKLAELNSYVLLTTNINDEGTSYAIPVAQADFSINQNTFNITINKSDHVALASINPATNISVRSHYQDEKGVSQTDRFPDIGFTSGLDITDMLDNSDDVNFSDGTTDNIIVDIEEISIIISE